MEGSGVGPVAEAEEVPPGVGAGVGVLAGVGELVDGSSGLGVLDVTELGELGELGVLGVLGVLDVPTRVGGHARRLGAAGVPSGRPTSCFNIVAATSRQTDLTMKASNAHTRAKQRVVVLRCVGLCSNGLPFEIHQT